MGDIKCYSELKELKTFKDRYLYLKLNGNVGEDTFGYARYLNQVFYRSTRWKNIRDMIIQRDCACDLGIEDRSIFDRIYIHHMNPLRKEDITNETKFLIDPEYLICTTFDTHNAIHYGSNEILLTEPIVRTKNDTCPWRK